MKRSAALAFAAVTAAFACDLALAADEAREQWYVRKALPGPSSDWVRVQDFPDGAQPRSSMEIYEVSQYTGGAEPTAAQRRAADELVRKAFASAEKNGWYDFDKAVADGFELMHDDATHYVKREHVTDDRLLDPDHPEFLMYYDTPAGLKLAGFMFLTRRHEDHGPQVGGPLTVWHYHLWREPNCLFRGLLVIGDLSAEGRCASGVPYPRSPEMIHVWLADHPGGDFATDMGLPQAAIDALAAGGKRPARTVGEAP